MIVDLCCVMSDFDWTSELMSELAWTSELMSELAWTSEKRILKVDSHPLLNL